MVDSASVVATADLSDAAGGGSAMDARIRAMWSGARLTGRAFTVRTPPGQHSSGKEALEVAGLNSPTPAFDRDSNLTRNLGQRARRDACDREHRERKRLDQGDIAHRTIYDEARYSPLLS